MKMRMSELGGAALLPDGSMSLGFGTTKETHNLEISAKAQEQLILALLARDPRRPQKAFRALDVHGTTLPTGVVVTWVIGTGIAIHLELSEPIRQKLQALLADLGAAPSAAH